MLMIPYLRTRDINRNSAIKYICFSNQKHSSFIDNQLERFKIQLSDKIIFNFHMTSNL